ncbi:MAG: hypothetical protein JXR26_09260 [Balneolaceae bacterium]|nr:hypothetical protein [Balneolaceae bacterium]
MENKYVDKSVKLSIDDIPVVIDSINNIPNENYIEVSSLKIRNGEAEVWYYYKIENISVLALLRKENDVWDVEIKKILQF